MHGAFSGLLKEAKLGYDDAILAGCYPRTHHQQAEGLPAVLQYCEASSMP